MAPPPMMMSALSGLIPGTLRRSSSGREQSMAMIFFSCERLSVRLRASMLPTIRLDISARLIAVPEEAMAMPSFSSLTRCVVLMTAFLTYLRILPYISGGTAVLAPSGRKRSVSLIAPSRRLSR